MRKLMESFKMFEHALSKDSVMEHFRNIISKVLNITFCIRKYTTGPSVSFLLPSVSIGLFT